MTEAGVRTALRTIAIIIAVTAAIDPAFARIVAEPRPLVVVQAVSAASDQLPPRARGAFPGRALIARHVKNGRLPCANDEDCVVIADGTVELDWDQRFRPVSLIKAPIDGEPNVRIQSASISRGHRAAAGSARVRMQGRGVAGKRTDVRVIDGQAVVGTATHEWSKSDTALVDVPWWPIDAGARALRIEAAPIDGEITRADNHVDIGASVAAARVRVLVFDARPSWQSTFVRRALEDDPRFVVAYSGRIAPSVAAATPSGRLDAATLDRTPIVIAGGIEALTDSDVSLLDRYVRRRGGTLILLPEKRPSGPSARLFDGAWAEQLHVSPQAIGPLRASELLRVTNPSPASTVVAASDAAPVIVSRPSGTGRIVIAGAMDAWRYRDGNGGFDRFWRSLAAEGAAAGEGLIITFADDVIERGSRTRITVVDRRIEPMMSSEARVSQRCGDALAQSVRVWPGGSIGEYIGEVAATDHGACTIEATVGDRHAAASFAVVDRAARGIDDTLAKLERRVRASGGVVANAGGEASVARTLADQSLMSRNVTAHPMRSPWWIVPFAACLSIEWWLRRQAGLR
ncbi:MAG TPA: hypothetical protein VFZ31_09740 [Vicinamibacterales bacterium]